MKTKLLLVFLITSHFYLQAQVTDFVTGLTNEPSRLIIDDNVIYIKGVASPGELIEIDLTDTNPSTNVLFTTSVSFGIGGLIKDGNTIYISDVNDATGESSLVSFNINTPSVVTTIASGFGYIATIDLYNNELYFTDESLSGGGTSLKKIDVTITNPPVNTVLTGLTNPQDMEFNGNTLYIGDRDAGGGTGIIYSVDASQATSTLNSFITNVNVRGVYVYNDFLYFSDAGIIKKVPFSNPSNITTEAMDTGSSIDFLRDVVISGTTLYMPQENFGKIVTKEDFTLNAQITDVLNPTNSGLTGFLLVGNELYYTQSDNILKINITDTSPVPNTIISGLSEPTGLLLNGNDLYFAQATANKVSKIDISLSFPSVIDVVTGLNEPAFLEINGNDLYISELGAGKISKIDITASLPTTTTDIATGLTTPLDIELIGNDLYIAEPDANKISKIDITSSLPTTATNVATGLNKPLHLALNGNDLYISEADGNKISKIDITESLPITATEVLTGLSNPEVLAANGSDLYFSADSSTSGQSRIAKYSFSILSIANQSILENYKVYPNPTDDYIQVLGLKEEVNYIIYNSLGKEILNGSIFDQSIINVENLNSGLYFLKVINGNTTKFIKK